MKIRLGFVANSSSMDYILRDMKPEYQDDEEELEFRPWSKLSKEEEDEDQNKLCE